MATPIDIFQLWQDLMSQVNVQQGGQIRPVQDYTSWLNSISMEYFHEMVALFQRTQQISDQLSPFHRSVNIVVTPQQGQPWDLVSLPVGYENIASMRIYKQKEERTCSCVDGLPLIDCDGECHNVDDPDYAAMVQAYAGANLVEATVNIVDTSRWGSCLDSITKGPTWEKPKATQFASGYKIAPKGISVVVLDYFETPRQAVFGYTIGAGDIVVYNPSTSTQLQWTNVVKNEFLARLVKKYGVAVREDFIYQTGEADKRGLV